MLRERNPSLRVMPRADYKALPALKAWTQLYELRRQNLDLLKGCVRPNGGGPAR